MTIAVTPAISRYLLFMEIRSLEHTDIPTLVDTLNRAFADYVTPLQVDELQLRRKLIVEQIDLAWSRGAFDGDRLVGFILHGVDEWAGERLLYNGGTGVLPAYRRRGFISRAYRELRPELLRHGFDACLLEVISHNYPAVRAYEKTGFQRLREVACLQGRPALATTAAGDALVERVAPLPAACYERLPAYWNFRPTWQHSLGALRRSAGLYRTFGLFRDDLLLAYGAIDDQKGRIQQFGVHPDWRRQGLGRRLFREMAQSCPGPLTILNIDQEDAATMGFLLHLGFKVYLQQYEMKWTLG